MRSLGAPRSPGYLARPPTLTLAPLSRPPALRRLHPAAAAPVDPSNGDKADFSASDGDEDPFVRPFPSLSTSSASDSIGAEYGEGFLSFRMSGEKTRLDVDTLNEALQVRGAARIRHSMRPDEAHGLVFDWDDVVVDSRALQRAAWQQVAADEGLQYPAFERGHMFDMRPERAAMHVLQWTQDMRRAQELAWLVGTAYAAGLRSVTEPLPGAAEWLALMAKCNIPCALVTAIDRPTVTELLETLGLRNSFTAMVTADDDMETIAQRYLSASIKLNRPPNQCVVFGATPASVAAAHNCTMRAVAVMGPHTAPELRSADLTVGSLAELNVVNIRRLFANRGSEFMDLKKARAPKPPGRRLRHAISDEERP
jgi:beta-phosphoglucomutase-like phosphatase (HAD superfamily)